jgi:hypothetical protein
VSTQHGFPLAATWLWLLDLEFGGVALDASATKGHLASELSRHFSNVHVLREDKAALDEVRAFGGRAGDRPCTLTLGSLRTAPWNESTFDCIAVHDRFAGQNQKPAESIQTLERLRHLLKTDGWLVAASPNPSYLRARSAGRTGIAPRALSRMLVEARFREVRRIFVTPSLDSPRTLIPDARRAVGAYEAYDSIQGTSEWKRRTVAGLGLHSALYPAYFIMACA